MRPNETLPNTPSITRLSDYIPPNFEIKSVSLDFDLSPQNTLVKSKMDVKRLNLPICARSSAKLRSGGSNCDRYRLPLA